METEATSHYSSWRWFTGTLLLLGIFAMNMLWNAPSPILTVITDDLRMSLAQGGFFMSIICLIFSASNFFLSGIGNRLNAKVVFLVGLLLMALGQLLFVLTKGYGDLLLYRCITGVGMGICNPVYAILVMENFPANERIGVNTIYAVIPYAATMLSLYTIVPLMFSLGGSWRLALASFGALTALIAIAWWICLPKIASPKIGFKKNEVILSEGPEQKAGIAEKETGLGTGDEAAGITNPEAISGTGAVAVDISEAVSVEGDADAEGTSSAAEADAAEEGHPGMRKLFASVARDREVRLLTIADIADTWGYNFLNSFLPTYFQVEVGMGIAEAASLTAIFPIAGIAAGLIFGFIMGKVGLRKPFTWPSHLCVFAGTLMIVLCSGPLRIVGILLAGIGNAAWAPALFTMPMEFEGMTAAKSGAAFAFIFGFGYLFGAFLSPIVGGWMGDVMSLRSALIVNSFIALIAALATFLMKETGPRKRQKEKAEE